jgi:hemolysin activation/secretion protein
MTCICIPCFCALPRGLLSQPSKRKALSRLVQRSSRLVLFIGRAGMLLALLCQMHAYSQPLTPQVISEQEQRRALERDLLLREREERIPNIRLQTPARPVQDRLPEEATCFFIQNLTINPSTEKRRLRVPDWTWALNAAAGPDQDDGPIQRCVGGAGIRIIIARIQNAIIARGFVTTRVLAEPQDLTTRNLSLTVVPGRIRSIRFAEGSDQRAGLFTAMPAKPGDLLNLRDIEQALENFKRVPTADADIQIEEPKASGTALAEPGQSDLVIGYRQPFPFRVSAFADDSGSRGTGKYQGGVTLSYDNWLTLSDLFYLSLNNNLGSVAGGRGTSGKTVHYSIPFGYWLLGATANASQYFQTVAGINQNYIYRGTSANADIKLSRLMYRDASRKTTVAVKTFQRKSNNFIDDTEVQVQRRVVGGWELSASHRQFVGRGTFDASVAYKRGTGAFGALAAPEDAFGEGTSRFRLTTADASLSLPFQFGSKELRYLAVWRSQYNHTRLVPQDRFAIGGRYTVRGFDGESSLSAERGWLLRNEWSGGWGETGREVYVGVDYGEVGGPSSELLVGKHLAGAVIGLRGNVQKFHYDVFAGTPLRKPDLFKTSSRVASLSVGF